MKNTLLASTAAFAMVASMASAGGHLAFGTEGGPFSWDSYDAWAENAPDLSGQTVTVFGPWLTPEDGYLNNALAYFEEATGADVIYTGSDSFEQQIVIDEVRVSAAFSADASRAATVSYNGNLHLFNLKVSKRLATWRAAPEERVVEKDLEDGDGYELTGVAMSSDGKTIIAGEASGRVFIFRVERNRLKQLR